jgi:hypothetical protein
MSFDIEQQQKNTTFLKENNKFWGKTFYLVGVSQVKSCGGESLAWRPCHGPDVRTLIWNPVHQLFCPPVNKYNSLNTDSIFIYVPLVDVEILKTARAVVNFSWNSRYLFLWNQFYLILYTSYD